MHWPQGSAVFSLSLTSSGQFSKHPLSLRPIEPHWYSCTWPHASTLSRKIPNWDCMHACVDEVSELNDGTR